MFRLINNLSMKKKMFTSFIIVVVLSLFGSVIGILELSTIGQKSSWVYEFYGEAQGEVNHFLSQFYYNELMITKVIESENDKEMQSNLSLLEESSKEMNDSYSALSQLFLTKEAKAILSEIDKCSVQYEELRNKLIDQVKNGNVDQARNILHDEILPLGEIVDGVINELIQNKQENGDLEMNRLSTIILVSGFVLGGCIILSIALSMLLASKIANGISLSIRNMLNGMHSLSEGVLDIHVPAASKDELGQMADVFNETCATLKSYINDVNRAMALIAEGDLTVKAEVIFKGDFLVMQNNILKMIESEHNVIQHIKKAADQVAAGSSQVSEGSQSMAEGAAKQSSSISELSETIEIVSKQIEETAANARLSSKQSNQAGELVSSVNVKMGEMMKSMEEIDRTSKEISKIISAINDIATQTNLLALNASIEAARAGEAGRGFAVVAGQVNVLANESAQAASESNSLINQSVGAVEKGLSIMNQMSQEMINTMENAKSAVALVDRIADAAESQSESVAHISDGIEQIAVVVQDNSATAEECSAASEELFAQAEEFKDLVGAFKLQS